MKCKTIEKSWGFTALELVVSCAIATVMMGLESLSIEHSQTISLDALQQVGYIRSAEACTNSFGQTYRLTLSQLEDSASTDRTLSLFVITTGGEILQRQALQCIVNRTGQDAGYVDAATSTAGFVGADGTWVITGVEESDKGHVGTLSLLRPDDAFNPSLYLHRKVVEGHPEYNAMETDLDMDAYRIYANEEEHSYVISAKSGLVLQASSGEASLTARRLQLSNVDSSKVMQMQSDSFSLSEQKGGPHTEGTASGLVISSSTSELSLTSTIQGKDTYAATDPAAGLQGAKRFADRSVEISSMQGIAVTDTYSYPKAVASGANDLDHTVASYERRSLLTSNYAHIPGMETHLGGTPLEAVIGIAKQVCQLSVDAKGATIRHSAQESLGRLFLVSQYHSSGGQADTWKMVICTLHGALIVSPRICADAPTYVSFS